MRLHWPIIRSFALMAFSYHCLSPLIQLMTQTTAAPTATRMIASISSISDPLMMLQMMFTTVMATTTTRMAATTLITVD